jgi:hypothetical protein
MNPFVKKALIVISVCFNVIFILFMLFAFTRKTAALAFYNLEAGDELYSTASCIVSVPAQNTDLVFGPPSFSLKPGDAAALQFSLFFERRQMNLALEPLYDREVVSVDRTGYGIIIKALSPGETTLQTITGSGIKNIAVITVTSLYDEYE